MKRCVICDKNIEENKGKLDGTMIKVKENSKNKLIYVCSECEKEEGYIEKAVIRAA